MTQNITFNKTGKEVKEAIRRRKAQLRDRLNKRNATLDEFLRDSKRVRSYLVRGSQPEYSHGGRTSYSLFGTDDISSEEKQEIRQLCTRIYEIEQELHRLSLVEAHLLDGQQLELKLEDLIGYGFSAEGITDTESI